MENKYPENPIIIVDDEKHALKSYEFAFLISGINNVLLCEDGRDVRKMLREHSASLVILDIIMPHVSGEDVLKSITSEYPDLPVIMITGLNSIEDAVNCMRYGAADYLVKPIDSERLVTTVRKTLEMRELRMENLRLQEHILSNTIAKPEAFARIVTRNRQMLSIFQYCEAIAKSSHPVLVTGETGVGKELFAKAIHDLSGCQGKFVAVNISGFDDNMLSDTLFGHRKGAFTGALENRDGMIEQASGGTLFLDEIGDISHVSQLKLLRLLQEKEYSPLGSDTPKISDSRVVLTTNQDLVSMQKDSKFRKDLYYRISTHHIQIPPLRDRKDDIPLLLEYFVHKVSEEMGKNPPKYHPELGTLLKSYHFPGNIRELLGMVYDAVSNHKTKMLSTSVFKKHMEKYSTGNGGHDAPSETRADFFSTYDRLPTIKEATSLLIKEALKKSDGNQSVAARILGITPQALSARLKKKPEDNIH